MSRTLYVVYGRTGEYSDRNEWPVRAFLDEAKAQTHVTLAAARAHELKAAGHDTFGGPDGCYCEGCYARPTGVPSPVLNEYDPQMHMDYTGTNYAIHEVPLDDDVLLDIAETVTRDVAEGKVRRALDLAERGH